MFSPQLPQPIRARAPYQTGTHARSRGHRLLQSSEQRRGTPGMRHLLLIAASFGLWTPFVALPCRPTHPRRRGVWRLFRVAESTIQDGLLHMVGFTYEMAPRINRTVPYIWRGIFDGRPNYPSTEGIQLINPFKSILIVDILRR